MQKTDSDYIVTPPVNKRWKSIIRNHQTNQLPAPWLTLTTELKIVLALKSPQSCSTTTEAGCTEYSIFGIKRN